MAQLITQFEKACSNVEPDAEDIANAAEAHAAIRDVLDNHPDLVVKGIDTVLIGSYKRHVSIRRVKDVDVLSRTDGLDMTAPEALDLFEQILCHEDAFGEDRVERQDRSIKIGFPDYNLDVDAVPARPAGEYWEIPDRGATWTKTNPEKLTTLSSTINGTFDGLYVPIVKLIRQSRRANLDRRPGGFYFEILTYHAFNNGLDGDNLPTLFVAAMRSVADQLAEVVNGGDVEDPTMPGEYITVRVTDAQLLAAARKFAALADKAEGALGNDDLCGSALAFREVLGKNSDDEWVFPMPASCNDDGTRKAVATVSSTATAGDQDVPAGNRRFA
ncbi:nucleotidyltransferase [Euzebya tangerina]|uniref:nucleotidyltransferase domain-containing protein n=1 Tax=Euzebya tangerina TaxID=591198 RepID=UPI000E30B4C8|nr:nucleotidyltransferase [Euzebya tangerina]